MCSEEQSARTRRDVMSVKIFSTYHGPTSPEHSPGRLGGRRHEIDPTDPNQRRRFCGKHPSLPRLGKCCLEVRWNESTNVIDPNLCQSRCTVSVYAL